MVYRRFLTSENLLKKFWTNDNSLKNFLSSVSLPQPEVSWAGAAVFYGPKKLGRDVINRGL